MKKFETPEIGVLKFAIEDVISTSTTEAEPTEETEEDLGDPYDEDCLPWD